MAIRKTGAEPLPELAAFLEPFSALVRRTESKHALERYTTGLLSDLTRKTAAQMGRSLPGTNDQRLQEFLTNTAWEAGEMDPLWPGLHRHLALVMLAHWFLTLQQSYGAAGVGRNPAPPARGFPPGGAKKYRRTPAART